MYKNLIFDLYGTLLDVKTADDSDEAFRKLAKFYAFRGAKYTAGKLQLEFRRRMKAQLRTRENTIYEKTGEKITYPEIDVVSIFKQLFEEKNVEADDALVELTENWIRITVTRRLAIYPGVLELLKRWKEQGRKLYLLSNAQRVYTEGELKATGLDAWFDGILLSSDYGCRKPDPIFFNELQRQFKLSQFDSVMIGNERKSDIAGACAAGIDSVLLVTDPSLAEPIDGIESTYTVADGDFRKLIDIPELF